MPDRDQLYPSVDPSQYIKIEDQDAELDRIWEADSLEVWEVARDLRNHPNRILYPTEEMGMWFSRILQSIGYGTRFHRESSDFHGTGLRQFHFLQEPHTVAEFVEYARQRSGDDQQRNIYYETFHYEKRLAAMLLEGLLTTDAREADYSLKDHFSQSPNYGYEKEFPSSYEVGRAERAAKRRRKK